MTPMNRRSTALGWRIGSVRVAKSLRFPKRAALLLLLGKYMYLILLLSRYFSLAVGTSSFAYAMVL